MDKKPKLTMQRMQNICGREGRADLFPYMAAFGSVYDERNKTEVDFFDIIEYFSIKRKRRPVINKPGSRSRRYFAHEL